MEVTFSPTKDARNKRKHGISLDKVEYFDFDTAKITLDDSQDYGEERWIALGFLYADLYVVVFTETETGIHAISLRKAEPPERIEYAKD